MNDREKSYSSMKRGAYRASPARRATISKQSGGERHLGVPTLEDKIVQRATVEVLNGIYEQDFLSFSYGFRPGRGQHDALDALAVGVHDKKVRWVLDADIRGFFDTLDHGWLVRRSRHARADVIIVRYADDFVVGFHHRDDGERFHAALRQRLAEFGLELHPEKTRMIEFGRFAATNRARRGEGKGESFVFLGLRHIYARTRRGRATLWRLTSRKSFRAGLREIKATLRRCTWWSIPQMGEYLAAALEEHYAYFGVPNNSKLLWAFRHAVVWLWKRALERRSERTRVKWGRMRLAARWIPPAKIKHPYPSERFAVKTRGRNRMR